MDENAKELCRREERLFAKKQPLDTLNQELALNFYPERADFTTERALGDEFAIDLYDSEPLRCRRDLGNARASMLRPAGSEWFRAETEDERINDQPGVARFLDWLNQRARSAIYRPDTGFVDAEKSADHDLVTFGQAVKTAESEVDRTGRRTMIVRNWHLRDCAWLDDRNGVRQDTIFRRFNASARHIRRQFPDAKLHDSITEALDKDPDQEFRLCHVMLRADEYDWYKKPKGRRKAPWASVYYDAEHKTVLRERPSERFRYVVDRWGRLSGSQYAYSPAALTALPEGRGIQTMAMILLEAAEKDLDPPLKAVRGAVRGDVNPGAAEITWVDKEYDEKTGAAVERLYPPGRNLPIGVELLMRSAQSLRDTWYLTKLTLPTQAKTAFETAQLVEEFIRANIPLFEPWEAGTAMMLDEIFGVLTDMRWFGRVEEWPPELSGGEIIYKFANPLQDAVKRNRVNQANTAIGLLAGLAQVNPEAPGARRLDIDRMAVDAVQGAGSPAEWVKDEEMADAEQAAAQRGGDILKALSGAGMAADVVNSGLDAAQKLQNLTTPAVDGSIIYGPT